MLTSTLPTRILVMQIRGLPIGTPSTAALEQLHNTSNPFPETAVDLTAEV